MLYSLKIKLTSPAIGEIQAQNLKAMRRGRDDGIMLDVQSLVWAAEEGAKSLRVRIPRGCLRFPPEIRPPGLTVYNRRTKHRITGQNMFVRHECIPEGAVITIDIEILDPPDGAPLDIKNVEKVLNWIGQWVGISQYGRDVDYGRFAVVSLAPHTYDDPEA